MEKIAPQELFMSMNEKKSVSGTVLLIMLGVAALFGGVKWLGVLIPVAVLVWYSAAEHGYRGNRSL
jgi:hypothetical protein